MFPKKNNPNKNRDSLYGDCPAQIGSPRDTNVEWYPLTEISDGTQFFSYGIESTKDYLLRGEFNEEMLGDKNLDSEEYAMLSIGVYPHIFYSFRKKAILIKLLSYYMVNTDQMMNSGYH